MKLQIHISDDGLLQIKLPIGITNQDLEIIVIYQAINQNPKRTWLSGFFERIFGAWQGEPLVRESQGELPERDRETSIYNQVSIKIKQD